MGQSEAMPSFTLDGRGKWRQQLKSFACICYYYVSSMGLILYNKWLFKKFGFAYPLSVTALHFTLCFLFACIWVRSREGRFCSIGSSMVVRRTVIIGVLTGIDVSLSNLSYLMVSIPFMEMVGASRPSLFEVMPPSKITHTFTLTLHVLIPTGRSNHRLQFS